MSFYSHGHMCVHTHTHIHTYKQTYIHTVQRYDLKGSTLGRVASPKEKMNPTFVFKDIDILVKQTKLRVGNARKKALATQVRNVCVRGCVCVCVKQTRLKVGNACKSALATHVRCAHMFVFDVKHTKLGVGNARKKALATHVRKVYVCIYIYMYVC